MTGRGRRGEADAPQPGDEPTGPGEANRCAAGEATTGDTRPRSVAGSFGGRLRASLASAVAMQVLLFLAPRGLALRRGFRAPCSCAIASIRRPARNAFERALRAAWRSRTQARLAVSRALEAAEAWDPGSFDASRSIYTDAEAWRLQAMAADPNSCLRRARIQARSALSLAARPGEASRAETLLVLIEHEAGLHGRELRDAVALAKLQPHNPDALALLKRARHCNRLEE